MWWSLPEKRRTAKPPAKGLRPFTNHDELGAKYASGNRAGFGIYKTRQSLLIRRVPEDVTCFSHHLPATFGRET